MISSFFPDVPTLALLPRLWKPSGIFSFFFSLSNTFTLNILFQYNAYPRVCIIIVVKKRFETKGKRSRRCKLPFRVFALFSFFFIRCICMNAMNNEIGIGENLVRIDHLAVFVQLIRVNVSNFTPIYDKNLFVNDYCLSSWENGI